MYVPIKSFEYKCLRQLDEELMEADDDEAGAHEAAHARSHHVLDIDLRSPSNAPDLAPLVPTESEIASATQSTRASRKSSSRAFEANAESDAQTQKQPSPAQPSQAQAKILRLSINGVLRASFGLIENKFLCRLQSEPVDDPS
jgi:hypothetical protein